jgi:hypothetical protein
VEQWEREKNERYGKTQDVLTVTSQGKQNSKGKMIILQFGLSLVRRNG